MAACMATAMLRADLLQSKFGGPPFTKMPMEEVHIMLRIPTLASPSRVECRDEMRAPPSFRRDLQRAIN